MEAVCLCETLLTVYQTTRRQILDACSANNTEVIHWLQVPCKLSSPRCASALYHSLQAVREGNEDIAVHGTWL
jgi:hypothetical protein